MLSKLVRIDFGYRRLLTRTLVKAYIEPTVVLVPTRIDDTILERLSPGQGDDRSSTEEPNDHFGLPYLLDLRPSSEFSYEGAKHKLANLDLNSEYGPEIHFLVPGDLQAEADGVERRYENMLRLASWIDVDSRLTVGCAGAVLSYLHRRRAAGYLPGDAAQHSFFRISSIAMSSMEGFM